MLGEYLPLLGLAVGYGLLSFAMQRVINRLPLFCSLFWPFIASWGICWTVVGYAIVAQYAWQQSSLWGHVARLAVLFVAALPGMWVAYRNQIRVLNRIFVEKNITKETTGVTIYFHELYYELVNKAKSGGNDSFSCFRNHLAVTKKHSNRYRRRHRV